MKTQGPIMPDFLHIPWRRQWGWVTVHQRSSVSFRDEQKEERISGGEELEIECRKRLRLSKEQSAFKKDSYKQHNTLNPKQKQALAKLKAGSAPSTGWFQNRRARKLKQTQVDCECLKRRCETLTEENRRLHKELLDLRALNSSNPLLCLQSSPTHAKPPMQVQPLIPNRPRPKLHFLK